VKIRLPWIVLATVLVAACSGIARHDDDQSQLDRYLRYAGAPIDSFTYLGRFDSWQSLSRNQLVIWTSINNAYLLTIADSCSDLQFAQRIAVSSTAGTVSRLDAVSFDRQRCPINEIRPVDYRQMRRDAPGKSKAATRKVTAHLRCPKTSAVLRNVAVAKNLDHDYSSALEAHAPH
jgi:hypothetical protein